MAKKKITKEPATAKELTSIPIRFRISSPTNKKATIIQAETTEALPDWICPTLFLREIMIGTLPIISITAKSTILAVTISRKLKLNSIIKKI
jgi:hypothetical protein